MAAGNLCSKGKEIGNELKEKVTPSAQREDMVITDSSVMSAATPGMYQVIVKIGQRCFLLPPSCDNVVPTELQKGQNIVLETSYRFQDIHGMRTMYAIIAGGKVYPVSAS